MDNSEITKFIKFTGTVEEALKNMKDDIDVLFSQNREIIKSIGTLKDTIGDLDRDVVKTSTKLGVYVAIIGFVGGTMSALALKYLFGAA